MNSIDEIEKFIGNQKAEIRTLDAQIKERQNVLRTMEPEVAEAKAKHKSALEAIAEELKSERLKSAQELTDMKSRVHEVATSLDSLRAQQKASVESERSKIAAELQKERAEVGSLQTQKSNLQTEISRLTEQLGLFKKAVLSMQVV